MGSFEIEVPRDRAGSFTPRLVRKGQRRTGRPGFDDCEPVRGRYDSAGDPARHLETTLGVELSAGTISKVTDAVCEAVMEWPNRPLEEFYPVIYLDAIRTQGTRRPPRDHQVSPHRCGGRAWTGSST
ncbi:transposase [Actinomyces ruminis]|uniref:transposase n=1 Tax=Actinomyces ruminis TaxID=1937003 RepID=UPI000B6D169B